jgi:glycosyltransferase involved in cell wall biosynthesis
LKLPSILFVSTMDGDPWGGSEELWSRTALDLASRGFSVAASVVGWEPPHPRALELAKGGIDLSFRPLRYPPWKRVLRRVRSRWKSPLVLEVERQIHLGEPALVVLSDGGAFPNVELLEMCVAGGVRFVTIGQSNSESWWLTDDIAERFRATLPKALRCFFVSQANRRLAMKQLGCELPNAEVVWNPFNIEFSAAPRFPTYSEDKGLLLACVARLHPPSKGQDILLEALASPIWADRKWRLHLCGEGKMRDGLERMTRQFGISDRVVMAGHIPVDKIWTENQVLVMPSRYEGLPLAIVEAMLCGRTIVATDVAGNSEIIDDGVTGFLAKAPTAAALFEALERLWMRRAQVEDIGRVAAARIRQLVPPDPIEVFSRKLRQMIQQERSANAKSVGAIDKIPRLRGEAPEQ